MAGAYGVFARSSEASTSGLRVTKVIPANIGAGCRSA